MARSWLPCVLALCLCTPFGAPANARAQAPVQTSEPSEYRSAVERALEEYQVGNFQEAREQFSRAHALFPNARTLRGLGFAAFELRDYVEAERYLDAALRSDVKPLEGKLRDECEAMLARARGYVGEIALELTPAQASVSVDGIHQPEVTRSLRLGVGDHVLAFHAPGYLDERRAVRVQGGRTETVRVALSAQGTAGTDTRDDRQSAQARPLYKRWWVWTAVGVVLAGGATAIAIALTRNERTEYRAVPSERTPAGAGIQALWVRP